MCMQVIIAALYYNPELLLNILEEMKMPGGAGGSVTGHVIQQWIADVHCFVGIHDRKICILGMCHLMQMHNHQVVTAQAQKIVPSCLLLFEGLKRTYAVKGKESRRERHGHDDGEDSDPLDDDEDETDEVKHKNGFLGSSNPSIESSGGDADDEAYEETSLEAYTTPLDEEGSPVDEYSIFTNLLLNLRTSDASWYNQLTAHLSEAENKALNDVLVVANQPVASREGRN